MSLANQKTKKMSKHCPQAHTKCMPPINKSESLEIHLHNSQFIATSQRISVLVSRRFVIRLLDIFFFSWKNFIFGICMPQLYRQMAGIFPTTQPLRFVDLSKSVMNGTLAQDLF